MDRHKKSKELEVTKEDHENSEIRKESREDHVNWELHSRPNEVRAYFIENIDETKPIKGNLEVTKEDHENSETRKESREDHVNWGLRSRRNKVIAYAIENNGEKKVKESSVKRRATMRILILAQNSKEGMQKLHKWIKNDPYKDCWRMGALVDILSRKRWQDCENLQIYLQDRMEIIPEAQMEEVKKTPVEVKEIPDAQIEEVKKLLF